jgi:glycosyltransferase involved in cell wall biosynthesis
LKVSIISINLNDAAGLAKTLASVKAQTYPEIEYIIIDGGSSDGSLEVIENSAEAVDYWISEKDSGLYQAMNKGIAQATGDYLLFLNSGDKLTNYDIIKTAVSLFEGEDIVYGNINAVHKGNIVRTELYPDALNLNFFITGSLPHQGMFIKRSVFSLVGLYSENLKICSDWKFQIDSICKFKCSHKHINVTIADFSGDGESSRKTNQGIIQAEKESILINEYSFLKEDLQLYREYKKLAFYYQYSHRIKLFRKLRLLKPILSGKFLFNYNTKEGF